MLRKIILSLLILLSSFVISNSQTLVFPGENVLSEAIINANSGDVLHLIPGGEYTETGNTVGTVQFPITIEMENYDPLSQKPRVFFTVDDGDENAFFDLQNGASITLRGIEFDGRVNGTEGTTVKEYLMQADVTESLVQTTIDKIELEDVYIHHLVDNVIDAGNSDMKTLVLFDSTFVNNCVIHDVATSLYYKYSGENYIEITNSTFYRLTSYGMRVSGPGESADYDHTPAALIDRTTWYDIGSLDSREIILLEKGPNQNGWTVTNSIFQKQISLSKTVINIKDVPDSSSFIGNICFWEIGTTNWRNHRMGDTLKADPGFADPDNGDFTLPDGSELYTFGSDGKAIGDPRWAPNPPTSIAKSDIIPTEYSLSQNYPNPFNPTTNIEFSIMESAETKLAVFDILGREVAELVNKNLSPGIYNYNFNGNGLPSGVYIFQLTSNGVKLSKKMLLNK